MEAKVPCVRFGLPPDKNKPHPRFPGVSASFDPASALQVYTDVLKKEKETLADGLLLEEKLDTAKRKTKMGLLDPVATQKNMDILPGYGSLTDFCQNFGRALAIWQCSQESLYTSEVRQASSAILFLDALFLMMSAGVSYHAHHGQLRRSTPRYPKHPQDPRCQSPCAGQRSPSSVAKL
ncbi:unnamed protein product [Effrenium voratum]|nr:unnamed protein product [Effrenium voratum]